MVQLFLGKSSCAGPTKVTSKMQTEVGIVVADPLTGNNETQSIVVKVSPASTAATGIGAGLEPATASTKSTDCPLIERNVDPCKKAEPPARHVSL